MRAGISLTYRYFWLKEWDRSRKASSNSAYGSCTRVRKNPLVPGLMSTSGPIMGKNPNWIEILSLPAAV